MTHRAGLPDYSDAARFPSRVWQAVQTARQEGFELACIPEVGLLLQFLAGLIGMDRICELGTAYGVGAAWIASGMREGSTFLTIEKDARRAAVASALFAGVGGVEVLHGDWTVAAERAPFDLLFSDGGPKRKPGDPEKLLPLLNEGALVVLDDYTPGRKGDDSREIWLRSPAYRAIELTLTPEMGAILATRL
jgi:predicted O-methyltransferase YrrM